MGVRALVGISDMNGDLGEEIIKLSDEERKALALRLKGELIPPKPAGMQWPLRGCRKSTALPTSCPYFNISPHRAPLESLTHPL